MCLVIYAFVSFKAFCNSNRNFISLCVQVFLCYSVKRLEHDRTLLTTNTAIADLSINIKYVTTPFSSNISTTITRFSIPFSKLVEKGDAFLFYSLRLRFCLILSMFFSLQTRRSGNACMVKLERGQRTVGPFSNSVHGKNRVKQLNPATPRVCSTGCMPISYDIQKVQVKIHLFQFSHCATSISISSSVLCHNSMFVHGFSNTTENGMLMVYAAQSDTTTGRCL